ncbi:MAG: hypothetical protein NTZ95_04395 [Candidatus Omnitrophica bacterium]|nr:hypothetical protein [Candidatus Omnitrophota bacterium]
MNKFFILLVVAVFFTGLVDCTLFAGKAYCQSGYYEDDSADYYEEPPQESSSSKLLKQGLLGAGTGAIAAGASGGNAGQGALIGAGTGIIGGALLDTLTQPSQPRRVYRRAPRQQQPPPQTQYQQPQAQYQQPQAQYQQQNVQVSDETASEGGKKKVIKKYDDKGKLVSEEEIYY